MKNIYKCPVQTPDCHPKVTDLGFRAAVVMGSQRARIILLSHVWAMSLFSTSCRIYWWENSSSLVSSFCRQLYLLILLTSETSFFFLLFLLESCSGSHPLMTRGFPSVSSPDIFMDILYLFFFSCLLVSTALVVSLPRVPTGSSSFNLAREEEKKTQTLLRKENIIQNQAIFSSSPPSLSNFAKCYQLC